MAKGDWTDPEWGTDGDLSNITSKPVVTTKYGLASGMDTMGMLKTMAEDYFTPRRPDDGMSGVRPAIVIHAETIEIGQIPDPVLKDMIDVLGKDEITNTVLKVHAAPAGGTTSMLPRPRDVNDIASVARYPRFYKFATDEAADLIQATVGRPCKIEITDKVTHAYGIYHGEVRQEIASLSAGDSLYSSRSAPVSAQFSNTSNRISTVGNVGSLSSFVSDAAGAMFNPGLKVYPPNSAECIALFEEAARTANLPIEWAKDPGLHHILRRESGGRVGIPNFTYGQNNAGRRFGLNTKRKSENFIHRRTDVWPAIHAELKSGKKGATSTATGLGQLILGNTETYYPSGRQGIGNPLEEAIGMLRYIAARYRNPARAWKLYGTKFKGY